MNGKTTDHHQKIIPLPVHEVSIQPGLHQLPVSLSLCDPDPACVVGARLDHERGRQLALHLRTRGDEVDLRRGFLHP